MNQIERYRHQAVSFMEEMDGKFPVPFEPPEAEPEPEFPVKTVAGLLIGGGVVWVVVANAVIIAQVGGLLLGAAVLWGLASAATDSDAATNPPPPTEPKHDFSPKTRLRRRVTIIEEYE